MQRKSLDIEAKYLKILRIEGEFVGGKGNFKKILIDFFSEFQEDTYLIMFENGKMILVKKH